jgi:hypothetical protein
MVAKFTCFCDREPNVMGLLGSVGGGCRQAERRG